MRPSIIRLHAVLTLVTLATLGSASTAAAVPRIPSRNFETAEACECHPGMVASWRESMHSKALSDPLYQLKLREAVRASAGLATFCHSCHSPIGVMGGEPLPATPRVKAKAKASAVAQEGVACDFCHQVSGTTHPVGNSSFLLNVNGVKRAQFADAKSPDHATAASRLHESAEFCGMCHDVRHPANGLPLESTYTEWKRGPYAEEGIVCQDCHMTPGPGVVKPYAGLAAVFGPQRQHIYKMTFAGGNVAVGDRELAEERLKAAAEIEVLTPEVALKESEVTVTCTVTNVGAGHYLPTGLTEVRQMWLEVKAWDRAGTRVLDERREFGTELATRAGRHPAEVWEAAKVFKDDRIPPRGSAVSTYRVTVPEGGMVVRASLYYRSAPQEMAARAGVQMPTTKMAEAEAWTYDDEADRAEATRPKPQPSAYGGFSLLGLTVAFFVTLGGILSGAAWLSRH